MSVASSDSEISRDVRLLVEAFKGITVEISATNEANGLSIEYLLPAFSAMTKADCQYTANEIAKAMMSHCNLTADAKALLSRYIVKDTSILGSEDVYSDITATSATRIVDVIKKYNPSFYEERYRFEFTGLQMNPIDFSEPFAIHEFRRNLENGLYSEAGKKNIVFADLSRFIRYIEKNGGVYLFKEKSIDDTYEISYLSPNTVKTLLHKMKLYIDYSVSTNPRVTAWTVLQEHLTDITVNGSTFYSANPKLVTFYHGFRYKPVERDVKCFTNYIEELCADTSLIDRVLNWMAFLVQKPQLTTTITLRLSISKGKPLIAKLLLRLLKWYSISDESKLMYPDDTFKSDIENKRLIVLDSRLPSFGDLYVPLIKRRMVYVSDRVYPTHRSIVDSAFIVIDSEPVRNSHSITVVCQNTANDRSLKEAMRYDDFYEGVMYLLMNRDISGYDPNRLRNEKLLDEYDVIIKDNYFELVSKAGIPVTAFREKFARTAGRFMKWSTMKQRMDESCVSIRKMVDGKQAVRYYLKDEFVDKYKPK